ncbi:MAG: diaminopimelate epimerase [Promethearchaeota archaeon]
MDYLINNLEFEKYHAFGNDYILVNDIELRIPENKKSKLAKELCRTHFSIGGDGLIFVCNSEKNDIRMRIFNSDGSEAEMCGNGIRCFSKYAYEHGLVKKNKITVETLKGTILAKLNIKDEIVKSVKIDMGPPIMECEEIPVKPNKNIKQCINQEIAVLDRIFRFSAVSMGNPHAIIFLKEQLSDDELNRYGNLIESHHFFPNKTNVEFVTIQSKSEGTMRVFERGVGITNSCGTGTCAVVVAGTVLGLFNKDSPVLIHNDGGDLIITYTGSTVLLEGPVEKVFVGRIESLSI